MVVLKFGGSSVADVESIRRVVSIIAKERRPRAVVVSALAGVTDGLLQLADGAKTMTATMAAQVIDALRQRHLVAAELVRGGAARAALEREIDAIAAHLGELLRAAADGLSPRSRDDVAAAGELWSSRLLAAVLEDAGVPSAWIDARTVLRTDSQYGSAVPDIARTRDAVTQLVVPHLERGAVAVLGGFIGSDPQGVTTTLGRGGSDCSAAVLGACLGAAEIQIWTDVDGVHTADPRVIPHARAVPHLSYEEAHDLAAFGAKVLHPGTIQPAVARGIPVLVRNSHRPAAPGTVVGRGNAPASHGPVVGLAVRAGVTLIEAIAAEEPIPDDFVTSIFAVLGVHSVTALLADLCGGRLLLAIEDLADPTVVTDALSRIASVRMSPGVAVVSAVGEGLVSDRQLQADAALALTGLPVRLVCRPAGSRAVAFVVDAAHAATAMARLHDCFFGAEAPALALSGPVVQA